MVRKFRLVLNGKPVELEADEDRSLLWALRTDLDLTGAKYGCGQGDCGACTVLVGDRAVRACLTKLPSVEGKTVLTIEGLSQDSSLHPLQQAFIEHSAFQCGYCTPGMLMSAVALLRRNPSPDRAEIVAHLEHNLCRCGSHPRVIGAVLAVARVAPGAGGARP
jgi:nicotinate dehydrogenase subunit A